MTDELEPLHAKALAEVVKRLRESPAVAVLIQPEHVFGPDAESLAAAEEWARCVLVKAGRNHGAPPASAVKLAARRDALVEIRAENGYALEMLLGAADGALHGAVGRSGDGFQHSIREQDRLTGGGNGFVSVTLTYALSCVPEGGAAKVAASRTAAPARRVQAVNPIKRPTP